LGRAEGKSHLEDLDGDGSVILDSIFKKNGIRGIDWINLAPVVNRWWALINMVMNCVSLNSQNIVRS
jgi:hypothetical protein